MPAADDYLVFAYWDDLSRYLSFFPSSSSLSSSRMWNASLSIVYHFYLLFFYLRLALLYHLRLLTMKHIPPHPVYICTYLAGITVLYLL
ncbi:hypothetical protein C8R46DRAFT_1145606 [Mycena filopes]|nr:hypothetical protein C8R46DRAFT_1145606 [Mycena filopes]